MGNQTSPDISLNRVLISDQPPAAGLSAGSAASGPFMHPSHNTFSRQLHARFLTGVIIATVSAALLGLAQAAAQPPSSGIRQYPVGGPRQLDELPAGRFRSQLEALPPQAQERALAWLRSFQCTEQDLPSRHADPGGGILYACDLQLADPTPEPDEPPPLGEAAVPVSPFPPHLVFHSRPGAPNVLYLNFCGETVVNTEWNTVVGRTEIPAVPFSTDSDLTTFSDAEQLAIKRIWQRVAEDYAPFNIDVTTERPATFTTRTAVALITRTTDANGDPNPYNTAGGVAYVNAFGTTTYAKYRPAWIYPGNLSNVESYIAEAASHEIGHNLGLSHDGKTDGTEYYGGHGSGDISWGPLMGTGYGRNVSQWSKGEYYLANNTQDDLATIAGKISYRSDDHANSAGTATALVLSGGTNIVSTTPENDPANTNTANKGVFERGTDLDVFSFVTGSGTVSLSVKPWITPSGTKGGNLDVLLQLYNEAGALLLANNPPDLTTALIQTNLSEGKYYLHVRNSGAGDPFSSTPTGYTAYGSLGQYFISGYLVAPTGYVAPPVAELQITDLTQSGLRAKAFSVIYSDNTAVAVASLDSNDVRITGPKGYDRLAQFLSVDATTDGTPRVATYAAPPPNGDTWLPSDNGTYTVWMQTNQVADTEGAWVAPGMLGQFTVAVPVTLYVANLDTDPGWTLEPQWEYGTPSYASGGPTGGFTGAKIIGYNLSGNYPNNLSVKYATTPPINCSGSTSATLRFKRWLRTKNNDVASIQVSTNGTSWQTVWSSSTAISDNSWQEVQYALPATVAGSPTLRLRWGLASNQSQNDIGWNLDDVEVLASGALDTTPPVPALSVANLTAAGAPSHSCSVTYTDNTAVRLASLGPADLVVTGPNGYSNLVEFVGADLPTDGSPLTATYSIPAPGGTWDEADNGPYAVVLLENEVEDIYNNTTPRTVLGSFDVAIAPPPTCALSVTVNNPAWGSVSPASGTYTAGSAVEVRATPATWFQFTEWTGDASGSVNPLLLVMDRDRTVMAVFAEVLTTNYPTPHWWLAPQGYTNDFENAVTNLGANGMPLWQSYLAGLNPRDPQSQLLLSAQALANGGGCRLSWSTVSNRLYTVWAATNLAGPFAPLDGAVDLPFTIQSYTNSPMPPTPQFYRLQVKKP